MLPIIEVIRTEQAARPEPSQYLTIPQAEVWRSIVDAMPANWFPKETHILLEQYCRHAASARHIALLIEDAMADPEVSLYKLKLLHDMQTKETGMVSSLALRMRLAQGSVMPGSKLHKKVQGLIAQEESNPWD